MKMFINVTLLPSYLWFSLLQSHAFPIQFPLITVLTPGELWDNYLFRFLPGNAHSTAHALSSTAALLFPKIVIMTDLHVSLLSSNSWPASLARFISPSAKMPWRPWHGKTPNHWTPNLPLKWSNLAIGDWMTLWAGRVRGRVESVEQPQRRRWVHAPHPLSSVLAEWCLWETENTGIALGCPCRGQLAQVL